MTYFKSATAGLAAVFLAAAVVYIVALLAIAAIFRAGGIALGFFWQFKRLSN